MNFWAYSNLPWEHVRSHRNFGPHRFDSTLGSVDWTVRLNGYIAYVVPARTCMNQGVLY